jgi:hypothetical protein
MFFLGGYDLEMVTIRDLLRHEGAQFHDNKLAWGAKTSAYGDAIVKVTHDNWVPVLIELEIDTEIPPEAVVVDHHGNRFAEPASLLQVIKLLELTPSRNDLLVASNDCGYIPAMQKMGATAEEISRIRLADRAAQGVTQEMERQAEEAIANAVSYGSLKVVRLPHIKSSPVNDRLFPTWQNGEENLLVVCETHENPTHEVHYFGYGNICKTVKETFSGWGGGQGYGDPKKQAFAGCKTDDPEKVIEFVISQQ